MAIETHEWNENSDHIVLFMDIMGFKDRVTRMGHKELLEKMIEFKEKNDRLKPLLQDKMENYCEWFNFQIQSSLLLLMTQNQH